MSSGVFKQPTLSFSFRHEEMQLGGDVRIS
jgi:hypothetical protein